MAPRSPARPFLPDEELAKEATRLFSRNVVERSGIDLGMVDRPCGRRAQVVVLRGEAVEPDDLPAPRQMVRRGLGETEVRQCMTTPGRFQILGIQRETVVGEPPNRLQQADAEAMLQLVLLGPDACYVQCIAHLVKGEVEMLLALPLACRSLGELRALLILSVAVCADSVNQHAYRGRAQGTVPPIAHC